MYVVPINPKNEVVQAVNSLYNEFGVTDNIISDAELEQKSKDMQKVCNDIVTNLRLLEEGKTFPNKTKMYIGM